jgi:CubicO group peptidase (beta-lactamase class C family)
MFHLKDHLADQAQTLTDASIDAMHQPTMVISANNGYGIGWFTEDRSDGYHTVSHNGGMPGVATVLMLVPSEDIAVVVLINELNRTPIFEISNAIMKVLLPKWQTIPIKPETPAPFTPGSDLLGTWKGTLHTYQKDLPVTFKFLPSGDVHIQLAGELESVMNHVEFKDGWFTGDSWGDVRTDDAERHRANTLLFSLKLRGNHINGAVSASEKENNPVALTQWLDVEKQP